MDIHTHVKVKLLLSPRHSRGITHFIYPEFFIELAYGFAALCAITTATRIWWGWKSFA